MDLGEGGIMAIAFKEPKIITREEWGAVKPKSAYAKHKPKRIVIHHTWQPDIAGYAGVKSLLAVQRYHMADNGWADIGYHFVVAPDGGIYACRPPDVVGAHCGNKPDKGGKRIFGNTGSIGIALIGNFDEGKEQPTDFQIAHLVQMIVWLQQKYEIPERAVYGHRECCSPPLDKTCPGRILSDLMFGRDRWNRG